MLSSRSISGSLLLSCSAALALLACAGGDGRATNAATDDDDEITESKKSKADDDDSDDAETTKKGPAKPACSAETCADGCCDGDTCVRVHSDAQCGTGGAACAACSTGSACTETSGQYACTAKASGAYEVTIGTIAVDSTKPDGSNWDTSSDGCFTCLVGCCAPDIYINKGSIAGLSIPKTQAPQSNTATARFSTKVPGTVAADRIVGGTVSLEIKDSDTSILSDDAIGTCSYTITAADVSAGRALLRRNAGCNGSIQSVEIEISKK